MTYNSLKYYVIITVIKVKVYLSYYDKYNMLIKDLLRESTTDVVARFYKEASPDFDGFYNPEDVKYKEKNHKYYDDHLGEWFKKGTVNVFTKPYTPAQPKYNTKPADGKLQSAGYRGLQYALEAAGLPYNKKVQGYRPSAPAPTSSNMDAATNNNGQ